jgi:hypothetical protein
MKITQRRLMEIIEQEVLSRLAEFSDGGKGKKKSKKGVKKPDTTAADEDPSDEMDPAGEPSVDGGGGVDPIGSTPPIDGGMNDDEEDGPSTDPTDGEGPDDEEAIDADGTAGEEPSGAVNQFASGKTIQAISIEPKSEVLPGAKEIVLTFNETTDPIRIQVTSTGQVKFYSQGQLHDLP